MKNSHNGVNQSGFSKWSGAGLLTALSASLCCITPVLALISGTSGVAATFAWTEPLRPYLIGLTTVVLGFAWYQKLHPRKEQIDCDCEADGKEPFVQSKGFLVMVTVLAIGLLAFPSYSHIFYSNNIQQDSIFTIDEDMAMINTVEFKVKGMTCSGCEVHVEHEVGMLPGIKNVDASYDNGTTVVEFASTAVDLEQIKNAINKTGYKIVSTEDKKGSVTIKDPGNISFYQVPLTCNAAPTIGCGSRSKPVLKALEENENIDQAWLNRRGTVIGVVWELNTSAQVRGEVTNTVFSANGIMASELPTKDYADNLDSFQNSRQDWFRGDEVNTLSREEAEIFADHLMKAINEKASMDIADQKKMKEKMANRMYDFFIKYESPDQLSDSNVYKAIMIEFIEYGETLVGKGNMPTPTELLDACVGVGKSCSLTGNKKGSSCCAAKKS